VQRTPDSTPPHVIMLLNAPARMGRLRAAIAQVCAALGYVHAHGLVHRDLKPSNIMVDDLRRVRLMDFGLVKLAGESAGLTLHGKVVGTYRYMSPEQARGRPVDARSDLYSLGVILFELLCGRAPFLAERPHDLWHDIMEKPPPAVSSLNPGVDRPLALVAERLLQKDPAERFQRADDVAAYFS
jgi:serine/threonine protein kinase